MRDKVGGKGGIGDYIPKPKGMHRRTFDRAMERLGRAEDIVEMHTALCFLASNGRFGRNV